jgi:hypothetical protein
MDSIVIKPNRYRSWTDYDDDYSDDAYIYEDRQGGESNNVYHQEERGKLSKRDEFENMVCPQPLSTLGAHSQARFPSRHELVPNLLRLLCPISPKPSSRAQGHGEFP